VIGVLIDVQVALKVLIFGTQALSQFAVFTE
jgi:hypothetical protein